MNNEIKQRIVDMVIKKMNETGLMPWQNGFLNTTETPVNYTTGKAYTGVNSFLLKVFGIGTGEYVTYKQAKTAGGQVKKGVSGLPVIWYSLWNKTQTRPANKQLDKESDTIIPYLKYSTVFEISQCEGLISKREKIERNEIVEHIAELDAWIERFSINTKLKITNYLGTPCYIPALHEIRIRTIDQFIANSYYYQTLLHELVHSTSEALGRKSSTQFGSKSYSKEEIVAEMGSLFLCHHFGIIQEQIENSAVYINDWSKSLKENPDWLISGISSAEKAYDYMIAM